MYSYWEMGKEMFTLKLTFPFPWESILYRKKFFFYIFTFFLFILGQERKFIRKVFLLTRKIAVHHSWTRLHSFLHWTSNLALYKACSYSKWLHTFKTLAGRSWKFKFALNYICLNSQRKELKFSEITFHGNIIILFDSGIFIFVSFFSILN